MFPQRPSISWVGFRVLDYNQATAQQTENRTHTGEHRKEKRNKIIQKFCRSEKRWWNRKRNLVCISWFPGFGSTNRVAHRDHSWYRCLALRVRS